MHYNNIDYSRLLYHEEMKNISNYEYQTIINFCNQCHDKYQNNWGSNGVKVHRKKGLYYYHTKRNMAGGPFNGNTMSDANYFKNCEHFMIRNIEEKHRELVLTNYVAHNNELFINVLNDELSKTPFESIEQIYEIAQNLIYLYNNHKQKFLFMKTVLKLEEKLEPIFNIFYEYYQINDPTIIINKITEIFVKFPEVIENNKTYAKKNRC